MVEKVIIIISDIDECTMMSSVCRERMVCENTVGGYGCKCRSGYVRVGDVCKGNIASFH